MNIDSEKRISGGLLPLALEAGWLPSHSADVNLFRESAFGVSFQFSVEPCRSGRFEFNGRTRKAVFPQVCLWRPGVALDYKYKGKIETLFFVYSAEWLPWCESLLERFGLSPSEEVFSFRPNAATEALTEEAKSLIDAIHAPGNADRVDRVAERLFLECLLSRQGSLADGSRSDSVDFAVRRVASLMDEAKGSFNLSSALRKLNLSRRSFSRHWKEIFSLPPSRYLTRRRLEAAAESLRSGDLSMKELAARGGFCDQFHFSKSFKALYGRSPQDYRKLFKS